MDHNNLLLHKQRIEVKNYRQMTKLTEFKLEFDTPRNVFAPGDQVPCKFILTLDDQLETKGIEVVLEGK